MLMAGSDEEIGAQDVVGVDDAIAATVEDVLVDLAATEVTGSPPARPVGAVAVQPRRRGGAPPRRSSGNCDTVAIRVAPGQHAYPQGVTRAAASAGRQLVFGYILLFSDDRS